MRYAYIKNGDAVEQVRRILHAHAIETSGPDAFIADFLQARAADDVLVQSRWTTPDQFESGRVAARGEASPAFLPRILGRAWSAFAIALRTLRWRPDRILCGCTGEVLWASALVARLLGVPIVHSRHNEIQQRRGIGRLSQSLDAWSMSRCTGLVCHGPFLAQQLRELPGIRTVPHSFEVDLRPFAAVGAQVAAPAEIARIRTSHDTLFLFVGRVQADKGVFDLLDAFRQLPADVRQRAALIYAGGGVDLARLQERIAREGLTNAVVALRRIEHAALPGLMRGCDFAVTPTRPEFPEGRCMVVLESLALGLPVIAPRFGPFPFAVEDGRNGLLYDAGNVGSLGECLARVIRDGDLRVRLRSGAVASSAATTPSATDFAEAVAQAFGERNEGPAT